MATFAEKKAALTTMDLSSVIFEDEVEENYYVSSPAKAAIPPIDLSSVLFEDEDENESCRNYVPSSPASYSSTTRSSTPPSLPPASSTKERKREKLEPADRSTDFLWPEGIRPEYLLGPSQIKIIGATASCNNAGFEVAIINGPRGQVVPFLPRNHNWAPLKPRH